MSNPFLKPLPDHGVLDFSQIEIQHYREAFDLGFQEQMAEIEAIIANTQAPSFANTVEALELSGQLLDRVGAVFFNLTSSDTSEALQAVELTVMPEYAAHGSKIFTNANLFERIKVVVAGDELLAPDQHKLLEDTYRSFIRAGAGLDAEQRSRVNAINETLATLFTQFSQNVLKDTNAYELILDSDEQLAGLPEFVLSAARAEADSRGYPGKHVFTISRSSVTPFLQYAKSRDLREKIYQAYTSCGNAATDNHTIIKQLVELRRERANLLGFTTHADYMLDDRMAKTPTAVMGLLNQVWTPAQARVKEEAADLQEKIQEEGGNFSLAPWDWWYYTEKIRQERFDLDEEVIKPYFQLENVRDGAFDVARRLYGITFTQRTDLPVYHPDVQCYDVNDADGSTIGIFLVDYFMRASKRGGAWMSEFRAQSNVDEPIYPVIVNCCNFPKTDPCLLGLDEVRTLFHEFGHGLHGLLSKVRYAGLSGTNVKQDFVELPSQIMEHWAMEPEVLKSYAFHVDTGEVIPDSLIEKLNAAETFNQGFATTEYLAASFLDMAWHGDAASSDASVEAIEAKAMESIQLIEMVDPRYKSSYFQHIFTDDSYSAGYYSYIWAEVLDADGYEAFKENGLFDQATARSFRENILEKGGTVEPMELYKAFRGREPDVRPLLKNRGLA